jgi:hypothetical protein
MPPVAMETREVNNSGKHISQKRVFKFQTIEHGQGQPEEGRCRNPVPVLG